ncbi:MAG: hypothetical protein D3924_00305 [Candidatus Electrothrix sp. AR4]|nr:hypothetical protein [Candidatus Electrothrix sp. AR4]
MESLQTLAVFFGWATIINIGLLLVATVAMVFLRSTITNFHAKNFGLSEAELTPIYFQFLANYKIAIIVLNLVPYIALKIML